MYIKKIVLTNIRCFEKQTITFAQKACSSIVISGDNGAGKSTLLRAIAMGLTDETSAAALLRELPGYIVRSGKKKGTIRIFVGEKETEYEIKTTISFIQNFERVKQTYWQYGNGKREKEIEIQYFPWKRMFVSGYGAGIRTNGTEDYQRYTSVDAVYPLFRYDTPLQNPELAIRRIIASARKGGYKKSKKAKRVAEGMEEYLMNLLGTLLNLKEGDKVELTDKGIEVQTTKWGNNELGAMGDGYRATTTWVMDLHSWWTLYLGIFPEKNIYDHRNIQGIVIIDELEQHLHPRWQKRIITSLRETFSGIQFIMSTHSPLVISGAKDTTVYAPTEEGELTQVDAEGWLAEDVYRDIMGIETSRPNFIQTQLNRYKELYLEKLARPLNKLEEQEMQKIKKSLQGGALPPTDPLIQGAELEILSSLES